MPVSIALVHDRQSPIGATHDFLSGIWEQCTITSYGGGRLCGAHLAHIEQTRFSAELPDLIVIDWADPLRRFNTLISTLRAHARLSRIPVVVFTADRMRLPMPLPLPHFLRDHVTAVFNHPPDRAVATEIQQIVASALMGSNPYHRSERPGLAFIDSRAFDPDDVALLHRCEQ